MSLLNKVLSTNLVSTNNSSINPLQLLGELKSGKISSNTILSLLRKNNPQQINQIEQMIKGKNSNQINGMINDLCKQKGINLNDIINLLSK